jgi:transcriptional regulator with XRE-family HTH domain
MERIGPKRPHWFIREWREHRRWTQEELADRAEMTKSMISEFESGKKRLNDDHVGMFCMVFGIEPQDLLRAPSGPDPIERMLRHAAPKKRDQAARIIEAFLKAG